jgi:hypothetical protein
MASYIHTYISACRCYVRNFILLNFSIFQMFKGIYVVFEEATAVYFKFVQRI